jgi:hypothetical protein
VIVRDWAEGFMRGVATHVDAWSVILLMDKRKLLAPILAASTAGQDLMHRGATVRHYC